MTHSAACYLSCILACDSPAAAPPTSRLRAAGPVLSLLFLSWLYAYYCYDYKWSLAGVRLPDRLAYFQRRWAFFAGRDVLVCAWGCGAHGLGGREGGRCGPKRTSSTCN